MSKQQENWDEISAGDVKSFTKEGESYVGYYISSQFEQGPEKKSAIHKFRNDDNDEVTSFWGSHLLDDLIINISRGDRVKITYIKKVKSQSGSKAYKTFSLAVDRNATRPADLEAASNNDFSAPPADDLGAKDDVKENSKAPVEDEFDDSDLPF